MAQPTPTQRTVDMAEALDAFDQIVTAVARGDGNVIVARDGVPTVAIVSLDALIRANRTRLRPNEQDAEFAALRQAMAAAFEGVSEEELERETDRAIAESRAARPSDADPTPDDDFAIIDELRAAFRGVPIKEIERETDRAIAEARAANRVSAGISVG